MAVEEAGWSDGSGGIFVFEFWKIDKISSWTTWTCWSDVSSTAAFSSDRKVISEVVSASLLYIPPLCPNGSDILSVGGGEFPSLEPLPA